MKPRILALAAALACVAAVEPRVASAAPPATLLRVENQLPSSYQPTRMVVVVDGAVRYRGPALRELRLPPGGHVVELVASYRMRSGILTYLSGYTVQVASAHVVRPAPHQPRVVHAFVVRNGDATTPLERSAAIDWVDR